jgi:hypothetical protein
MKKIYQKPETLSMPLCYQQVLLTGSATIAIDNDDQDAIDASGASARGFGSVWDEEDDEEF